jgi:hypothetical protein
MVGPYLLPNRLNGPAYCVSLQEVLPVLLEDVPLAVRRDMWFQHDGAAAYFSAQTQQHLNTQFPDRWLGRGGPELWPARLPDLNPLDFFLWEHLKEIVYRDPPTDVEDLTAKFHVAVATIDADVLRRVQANIPRRAVARRRMHGEHCEHCNCTVTTALLLMYLLCSVSASVLCSSSAVYPDMCELCTLLMYTILCINSLVHECHLQFLCCYSTLCVSASVSQHHH